MSGKVGSYITGDQKLRGDVIVYLILSKP